MIQEGWVDDPGKSFVINSIVIPDSKDVEAYSSPESAAARLLEKPVEVHYFLDGPDAQFDGEALREYLSQTLGANFTISFHGDIRTFILNQADGVREKAISQLVNASSWNGIYTWRKPLEEKILSSEGPVLPVLRSQRRLLPGYTKPMPIEDIEWYSEVDYTEMLRTVAPSEWTGETNTSHGVLLVVTGRGIANPEGVGFHMRVSHGEFGIAVVSTTGLVKAPGISAESYRDESGNLVFRKSSIEEGDPRIAEAARGSAMQMIMVALGESGKVAQCSHSGEKPDNSKTCRMRDGPLHYRSSSYPDSSTGSARIL